MDDRIIKFLKRHRIAVLTTLIKDDQPHSAALHYSFNENPFYFVFWTGSNSRKLSGLQKNVPSKGSLVIGFSEEEWLTMQMEGEVKWVSEKSELDEVWPAYAEKYKERKTYYDSPDAVIVKFTPTWWRYSEVKPSPAVKISSEDTNK